MKKLIASLLVLSIFAPMLPSMAKAGDSYKVSYDIGPGLAYSEATQDKTDTTRVQAFEFTYTPNDLVQPIVVYGDKLYGKSDINTVVNYAQNQGFYVMGAVNSDFFEMNSGIPTGIVIRDGELISSDGYWNGIAFSADGKAYAGAPQMSMSMTSNTTGQVYPIYAFNKDRTGNGIHLFNGRYSGDTKSSLGGTMVVLQKSDASPIKIGQPATFTVQSVTWQAGSVALNDTQYALSYNDKYTGPVDLATLQVGDTLSLSVTAEEHFQTAQYATGGGDLLAVDGSLTAAAKNDKAPRTIVGVKGDGSFKIVATDGRQSLLSEGVSLADGARQLVNEGYPTVINLDGGGSTAMTMRKPGDTANYVTNSPSEGALRKCATYIVFVNKAQQSTMTKGQVYPINPVMYANRSKTLYALGFDDNYHGFGEIEATFAASLGSMDGSTYTAPHEKGQAQVTGISNGFSLSPTTIDVITEPDRLYLLRNGSVVPEELSINTGEMIDFNAMSFFGSRKVLADDKDYYWSVSGNCGTVDENGVFTAAAVSGAKGSLTLAAGVVKQTVQIKIGSEPYLISDFEHDAQYSVSAKPEGAMSAFITRTAEEVRYGKGALKINWANNEVSSTILDLSANGGSKTVSLWVKKQGTGDITLDFAKADGTLASVPLQATESYSNVIVTIPSGTTLLKSITVTGGTGSLLVDNIWAHFDNGYTDTTAPALAFTATEGGNYLVSVTENTPLHMTAANMRVYVDGVTSAFQYNAETSTISFSYTSDGAPHKLTVTAQDYFGNIGRVSYDITPSDGYTVPFADMTDSWAKNYVGMLTTKGVFSQDTNFNPNDAASNAMVATMISRYLGLDTSKYTAVELPFIDKDQIDGWALDHVKALYAEGIMKGGTDAKDRPVFRPKDAVTRAQVMTILSRTMARGYPYSPASFDDNKNIPSWAFDHVSLLQSLGIVNGYGGANVVMAQNNISRVEIASLLYKLY